MEQLEIVRIIIAIVSSVVGTCVPFVVALIRAIKKRKDAHDEAERAKADTELTNAVTEFITAAEITYKQIDDILKGQGSTAGGIKKETVMTKAQAYALEHGFTFDKELWSAKIDEIVKMTRVVNAKK